MPDFCLDCRALLLLMLQFIMVTEPVMGSLDNFLHSFKGVPNAPGERQSIDMPELEVKHGLLQVLAVHKFSFTIISPR